MKKIAIIGAGAFGFAMAKIIGDKHLDKEIFIFDIQKDWINHIKKTRKHPVFHGNSKLSTHILVSHSIVDTVKNADIVLLAVPSVYVRVVIKEIKGILKNNVILLNVAKGLEPETNYIISQIVSSELRNSKIKYNVCSLSGGMIAREVTKLNPLCAEVACEKISIANKLVNIIENKNLRLEATTDLVGVELAGALKNVIAIGAGIFDGLSYGESSKSAFVSFAAKEAQKIAISLGAKKKTFESGGQAWFGDLMTTCFGASRNRAFGELIGRSENVEKTLLKLKRENKTVEGYKTAEVVYKIAKRKKINTPLIDMVYKVLYNNMPVKKFVDNFITHINK
ncbi:MAG: NAD(P)H-dependent glycerol-3-phosphate dehydrogenase [bacterium]|nr:NAD(P)H-dependent glycerol-3-phosphate dehydrogenase [bacterium]